MLCCCEGKARQSDNYITFDNLVWNLSNYPDMENIQKLLRIMGEVGMEENIVICTQKITSNEGNSNLLIYDDYILLIKEVIRII